jgi:uncharacterized protein YkwD
MNKSYGMIVLLGMFLAAGCSTVNWPGYESVYVPLNTGVKDASFLSSGELEIVHDMLKARAKAGDGSLKPLRLSRGLSFAAKQKAVETADTGQKENAPSPQPLMARVQRFGKVTGSVAELVSHGYPQRIVVDQLMKPDSPPDGEKPDIYFLDPRFTVAGVGCTGDFYPICVLTFATDFEEP